MKSLKINEMINFEFNFGRWLKMKGERLKGGDLAITLLFLSFVIALIVVILITIEVPKVQVLF